MSMSRKNYREIARQLSMAKPFQDIKDKDDYLEVQVVKISRSIWWRCCNAVADAIEDDSRLGVNGNRLFDREKFLVWCSE